MRDVYANPTVRRLAARARRAEAGGDGAPRGRARRTEPSNFAYCAVRRGADRVLCRRSARSAVAAAAGRVRLDLRGGRRARRRSTRARSRRRLGSGSSATTRSPSPPSGCCVGRVRADRRSRCGAPRYFRFWAAKLIVRSAPANAFAGTPLFNLYLRLLGAKIGAQRGDPSRNVPVGLRRSVRGRRGRARHRAARCCRATPPSATASTSTRSASAATPTSASRACSTIGSAIGDFGQLGHASSLQQRPARAGRQALSPARRPRRRRPASASPTKLRRGRLRRALFTAGRLAFVLAVAGALDRGGRDLPDERADRGRRRARAEARSTRSSPCCRCRRRRRSS